MLLWVIVIVVCIVAYLMLTGKGDFKNLLKQTNDTVTNNIK